MIDPFTFLWFFDRCELIRVTSPLSEAGRKHKCHADLVEQHVIRQLISASEYTKPVRFFASVDARKRLKPASTEDGCGQAFSSRAAVYGEDFDYINSFVIANLFLRRKKAIECDHIWHERYSNTRKMVPITG